MAHTTTILWTTNVPASAGTIEVFARRIGLGGGSTGPEIEVLPPTTPDATSVLFGSASSGVFELFVRLKLVDGREIVRRAPMPVRVSALPSVLWLEALAHDDAPFAGAVFQGVRLEDNAGSSVSPAGDINGDQFADFVVGARYGKPLGPGANGIGPGEAYLIFGGGGAYRPVGVHQLEDVGTASLRGVALTGIPTMPNSTSTDGLASIALIPDADSDGRSELAFGFPSVHSASAFPLEAEGQFLRGGVVVLSSNNSLLRVISDDHPQVHLAEVGQRFSNMAIVPGSIEDVLADDRRFENGGTPATRVCVEGGDGVFDTVIGPGSGFIAALARPLHEQLGFTPLGPNTAPREGVCPTVWERLDCGDGGLFYEGEPGSGFYAGGTSPLEPRGARIIGASEADGFGRSIAVLRNPDDPDDPGELLVAAPTRTARATDFSLGSLDGDVVNSGVAFVFDNRRLWGVDARFAPGLTSPTPHQYMIDTESHCGDDRAPSLEAVRVAGGPRDRIQNIVGLGDFDGDGRSDLAVGAPQATGGRGQVYVAYRRDAHLERDYVLANLGLDRDNADRMDGLLVVGKGADAFGSSLATSVDFNGDGIDDLAIGSPNAGGGVGEVIIIFGQVGLTSERDGVSVTSLLEDVRTPSGAPVAVRITGSLAAPDGDFGFNVACAGDVNGDGFADLMVSAPGDSPRFDPDPTDDVDELAAYGLDLDQNGQRDDVGGPLGSPDQVNNEHDQLVASGVVYVISGRNRLDWLDTQDMTISIDALGTDALRGFMIVGRRAGDRLGGGDAGSLQQGGAISKTGRGRSRGLAGAGDVNRDRLDDMLIGSVLADPRLNPRTGAGIQNAGEAYLIYGFREP